MPFLTELDLDGRRYGIEAMSAMDQLHVFRRILPLLKAVWATQKDGVSFDMLGALMAMADDIAEMPDEKYNYVLQRALGVVKILGPEGRPQPLMVRGQLTNSELDAFTLQKLMAQSVYVNILEPFFKSSPGAPSSGVTPSTA